MWIKVVCGACGIGNFQSREPLAGWACERCGHVVVASDIDSGDGLDVRDGALSVLDLSY